MRFDKGWPILRVVGGENRYGVEIHYWIDTRSGKIFHRHFGS